MPKQDRRRWLNTALLLLALGAIAVALVWAFSGERPSDDGSADAAPTDSEGPDEPSFGPFEIDHARLEAGWQAERESLNEYWREGSEGGRAVIGEAEQSLLDEFYRINAQSLDEGITASQLEALNEHLVVSASNYIRRHGPRAWKALGWELVQQFLRALDEVSAVAAEAELTPAQVVRSNNEVGRRLRERLGNFVSVAQRTGLVDEDGELAYDEALAIALFRYRWFGFAEDYASASLLTPYERVLIGRWQVEAAEGLPLAQRLALVHDLEPSYAPTIDPDAVRGILYYRAGELEQARAHFRRARRNHPDDPRYGEWERHVEQRLGAPG